MDENRRHSLFMIEELAKLCPISKEFRDYLLKEPAISVVPNKAILHFQNTVPLFLWFVVKGTVRRKVRSPKTHNYETDFFWFAGQLIGIENVSWTEQRADVLIDVVEDTILITFTHHQFAQVVERFPKEAANLSRILTANYMQRIEELRYDLKYLTHSERYQKLVNRFERLISLVTIEDLADYLSMSRFSFMRQRKLIKGRKDGKKRGR
ncbi:Crp/Fnr family transcriptional regulator [Chitinophaga sp. S165]|uniref:Crp/Fnr family transcriptional regulator n=1 Tax=Chitinophaga sp. S165 TaxID=2135462 RepID=UPI000D714F76|nr:Crp/Fnr family transcriptional regulator [Chitinophaga sp. S165]PWV47064.1 CRP-like cAMP-binding protein [Chitinophaga sp. S165]